MRQWHFKKTGRRMKQLRPHEHRGQYTATPLRNTRHHHTSTAQQYLNALAVKDGINRFSRLQKRLQLEVKLQLRILTGATLVVTSIAVGINEVLALVSGRRALHAAARTRACSGAGGSRDVIIIIVVVATVAVAAFLALLLLLFLKKNIGKQLKKSEATASRLL